MAHLHPIWEVMGIRPGVVWRIDRAGLECPLRGFAAGIPPETARPLAGARPATLLAAPPTVEQLAERLRAMEELNRKLLEQLEQSNRAHDREMNELRDRLGQLSNRLNGGSAASGV